MVAPTLGEFLPTALAVALSPIPVVAVVIIVGSARARTSGPDEEPTMPSWMATLDGAAAGRAVGSGAALAGANPKNIALVLAAATTIAQAGLDRGEAVLAVSGFVAIGSVTVVGAVLLALFGGRHGAAALGSVREFMAAHNAPIMVVVLVLLGGNSSATGSGSCSPDGVGLS